MYISARVCRMANRKLVATSQDILPAMDGYMYKAQP